MYTIFTVIHVITCVLIVAAVLLQSGRSGGFAGVFGSSGEVIFSTPSGSSFLRKVTTGLAVVFGVTSLTLAVLSKARMYRSVVLEQGAVSQPAPQRQAQPAAPAAAAEQQPSAPAPAKKSK